MLWDALIEGIEVDGYGQKETSNPGEILRELWEALDAQTFVEWLRRTLVLVQSAEVLLACVFEQGERRSHDKHPNVQCENKPVKGTDPCSECPVQYLRENGVHRGSPQRRKSVEQLTRKLGALMQELSHQTTPRASFMRCLWSACEGSHAMQQALAGVEEIQSAWVGHGIHANDKGEVVVYPAVARTLAARYDSSPCDDRGQNVIAIHQNADGEVRTSDKAYTVNTNGNASGRNSPVIALQANGIDRAAGFDRYNGEITGDVTQTLAGMTRDNNVPHVIALQANGIDRADTAGCNGAGWREGEMYTLNTIDRHAVVFENHAQDSRITECGDVAPVVSAKYGTGGNNTPIVCEPQEAFPRLASGKPVVSSILSSCSEKQFRGDQEAFSGNYHILEKGTPPRRYIVRRLTPTECLRLQGYPDDWCDIVPQDDAVFWNEVRAVYARIMGKTCKPLSDVSGYVSKLKTDAAIYKAAGNSLAIPCAYDVLRRCVDDEWNRQTGMF